MSRRPVPNVLAALTQRYWAILPETLETMYEIAARENLAPEAVAAKLGRPLDNTRAVTIRDGVATVPAVGPMFRYANFFSEVSGAVSYDTLATDLQAALDHPQVHTVLLDINSPGGDADGIASLAELVYQARGSKRVVALASDYAASAAYWLASAADEIVATPTAILGSIGVRATYVDRSQRDAAQGYREITIVSSQSPRKAADPTTDDGRAQIRATLDALAQVFIDTVARNRGVSSETVAEQFGQGDVLVGQAAVDAGLADRLATYEFLHAELSAARGLGSDRAQLHFTGRPAAQEVPMAIRPTGAAAASGSDTSESAPLASVPEPKPLTQAEIAAQYHDAVLAFRAEGAAAERTRLAEIDGIATPAHAALVAAAKADPTCSADRLARQILGAEQVARTQRLGARAADEAALVPPAPLAADAMEPTSDSTVATRVLTLHKQLNTPRRAS